jgi:hypothetical protein
MFDFKKLTSGNKDNPKLLVPGKEEDLTPEQKLERFQKLKALNRKVNIFFKPEGEYIIEPIENNKYKWVYYMNQSSDNNQREISQLVLTYDGAKNVLKNTIPTMIIKESTDPKTKEIKHPVDLAQIITKTQELLSPQILDIKRSKDSQSNELGYELNIFERKSEIEMEEKNKKLLDQNISNEEAIQYYSKELLKSVKKEKYSDETSIRKALADIWSEHLN